MALEERGGWGNSLPLHRRSRRHPSPASGRGSAPQLLRNRTDASIKSHQNPLMKAHAMLDVPNKSEKSYANGKILQNVSDGIGVITFNNPEKRNAMSLDMWEGLGLALV